MASTRSRTPHTPSTLLPRARPRFLRRPIRLVDDRISRRGYVAMGSFHSDSMASLLAVPDDAYTAPSFPPGCDAHSICEEALAFGWQSGHFGAALRPLFRLSPEWLFLNHGAFGAASAVALTGLRKWQAHMEEQPLRFIDRELFPFIADVLRELAALVRAPATSCSFIPHATFGLNSVIRSWPLHAGDVVVALDVAYGSVKTMLQEACRAAGAELVII
ncbi:hypothetical protein EON66_04955, partial [archaeon]